MLRALKDLVLDLEKVVKLQYVSQLLHIYILLSGFMYLTHSFFYNYYNYLFLRIL